MTIPMPPISNDPSRDSSFNDIEAYEKKANVKKQSLSAAKTFINTEISNAKAAAKTPEAQWAAGQKLMESTKQSLAQLKRLTDTEDEYQVLADNLAKNILQRSINYFNNSKEDEEIKIDKAMVLQEYARSIAERKMTKERCKENIEILKKKKADLPPPVVKEETKAIHMELADYCKKPDLISHALTLLGNTKPLLQAIKRKLGAAHAFYLKISSLVVDNALYKVIEEVNAAHNKLKKKIELQLASGSYIYNWKLKLDEAWGAALIIDDFDLDEESKQRYGANRRKLFDLCNQFSNNAPSPTISTAFSGGSAGSPSIKKYRGCLLGIVILIIIICLCKC